jgi:nucleoside-diphosphate-sugar epimerase
VGRTLAVTGGSGFLGAAIISRLLDRGDLVRALARNGLGRPSSDRLLEVAGSLEDEAALDRLARSADAVIHCAGLTHARRDADFFTANAVGAGRVAAAAARAGARLVHVSSMAARRPDLSAYARSKRDGEDAVSAAMTERQWAILRAPALYGPGDRATLPYFRLIRSGFAPEPRATPEPRASILYVDDAAAAALAAIDGACGVYEIGDETANGRSWREIGETLAGAMGVKARRIRMPAPLLSSCAALSAGLARAAGAAPMVTPGKIREFFHSDWVARERLFSAETPWRPETPLHEGFAKTARWYQKNGWL